MITTLGSISLTVALIVAVYTAAAGFLGAQRRTTELIDSARNGVILFALLITIAIGALAFALATRDFSLTLVANNTSRDLPMFYTVTALWSGQAGSLLFWSWLLSLYSLGVILKKWETDRDLMPYVIAVLMGVQVFFALMLNAISSPFAKMETTPADGAGLNPLLQHPGMVVHPPLLYLGYVGFTVPFAFALAALISGRLHDSWIRTTRRWTMVAWLFLGLGLFAGGRWAYDVLGWGGYWGWDPVENAALMPWLGGTAFLHSVMVQERKGALKVWNLGLIIITFGLVLFGTFLTRSGVIQSVHAFTQSEIGVWFLTFIALVILTATVMLFTRLDALRSEHEFDALLSREVLFLVNNILFLGAAMAILIGVIWPIISQLVTGETLTVGPPYYNLVVGSIFAAILLLMGIIPLIGWGGATLTKLGHKVVGPLALTAVVTLVALLLGARDAIPLFGTALVAFVSLTTAGDIYWSARARQKNTRENLASAMWRLVGRNRRRYGGYLIHLAVMVMAVGIIGTYAYSTDETRTLTRGESFTTRGYTLTYEDLTSGVQRGEGIVTTATVGVSENGQRIATLKPAHIYYPRQQQPETVPAIYQDPPFFRRDLYVIVQDWSDNFAQVSFRAYVNPMVSWLWAGGALFMLATVLTLLPDAQEAAARAREFARGAGALSHLAPGGE